VGSGQDKKFLLSIFHPARLSAIVLMTKSHDVEQSMDDETQDSLIKGERNPFGLFASPIDGDYNVSDNFRR
jgi:hypothetical protein